MTLRDYLLLWKIDSKAALIPVIPGDSLARWDLRTQANPLTTDFLETFSK